MAIGNGELVRSKGGFGNWKMFLVGVKIFTIFALIICRTLLYGTGK